MNETDGLAGLDRCLDWMRWVGGWTDGRTDGHGWTGQMNGRTDRRMEQMDGCVYVCECE